MNTQDAARHLLREILSRVIQQTAEQPRVPMYPYYQKITSSPLQTFHNCLHFIPFDEFSRQDYTFLTTGLLCIDLVGNPPPSPGERLVDWLNRRPRIFIKASFTVMRTSHV